MSRLTPRIEEMLDRHVLRLPPAGASTLNEAQQPLLLRREVLRHVLRDRGREACRRFLGWRQNGLKVSHDIYLKSFALDEDLIRHALRHVDYVCLDEAQDLNPVMRQIAVAAGHRRGDPWQAIYGWRGAQAALRHLPGDRLYLSQSFRFGDAVAAVARRVLASRPGIKPERPLRGVERQGLVRPYAGPPQGVRAVLCRTNAGLLKQAFALAQIGRSFHVPGGIEEMAAEVRSAQALAEGRIQEVKAERLRRFVTWEQFIEEAEETGDAALGRLRDAVEEGVVHALPKIEAKAVPTEDKADVVLSTVHKAKGREWDSVALASDFPELEALRRRWGQAIDSKDDSAKASLQEEWNILYVGVTRAVRELWLPLPLFEAFGG